jgi:hypothetical protein
MATGGKLRAASPSDLGGHSNSKRAPLGPESGGPPLPKHQGHPQSRGPSAGSEPRGPPPSNPQGGSKAGPVNPKVGVVPKVGGGGIRERIQAQEAAKQATRAEELRALDADALYITIFFRTGEQDNFHWCLYYHEPAGNRGTRYHIQGTHGQLWNTDHGVTTGALASNRLLALVGIKKPVGQAVGTMTAVITEKDHELSVRTNITCRIYIKEACERLKQQGMLHFNSWADLEAEVFSIGNRENPIVHEGFQSGNFVKPRPVVISTVAR